METWVSPHLTGGLGNRLFEYASAAGASEKWNVPLVFSKAHITKNDHGPDDSICKLFPDVPVVSNAEGAYMIREPAAHCFIYVPFEDAPPAEKSVVDGWRQTDKYFPKSQPIQPVWSAFLSEERKHELRKKYDLLSSEKQMNTWFLHIRLGDYKVLHHHQINGTLYNSECLDKLPRGSRVILFSDEPHLCVKWAEKECKARLLEFQVCEEVDDEIASLWLMSQIWGGAIVANSTFSWWGAYFARHTTPVPEAYVAFYPSVWGKGLPEARDVVPSWGRKVFI